jgi:hypothetical protein
MLAPRSVTVCVDILNQLNGSTVDSLVANFKISDAGGDLLCCLEDVEVARHESLPLLPPVRRYDVVFQPMSIPSTLTEERNTLVRTPDMRSLYTTLDQKAIIATTHTLRQELIVGAEVGIKFPVEPVPWANYVFVARSKALL